MAQNKGFTLLELILVVLIISALVGLSTPMFRKTLADMQFNQACMDLNSALNYARQAAILNKGEYQVKLNAGEGKFWIQPGGKAYSLPKEIKIISDKGQITFYPTGRCEAATITVTSGSKSRTFTTEGTAGYVKIK